jgi:RND family efflux transporter MFP subunit
MTSTVSRTSELDLSPALPASGVQPTAPAVPASGVSPVPHRHRGRWLTFASLGTLGALFLVGYVPRHAQQAALAREARAVQLELPRVLTVTPKPTLAERALLLPGSIEPLETAQVHSRASGFVRQWLVDMGERVEAGQLLAQLDTPELDRELDQARATLARANASILQAAATSEYSSSTLQRYTALAPEGLVSRQELAQYEAQAHVASANIRVAKAERGARSADLARLEQLQRFARIVAPFAGTISARHVERGELVTGASSGPLFEIVATDPVRVLVQVPQSLVADVAAGLAVDVVISEYPGQKFAGTLTRTSGTLDPDSRTMRAEVRVPNADGRLLPGMYASVSLLSKRSRPTFSLPATALISGGESAQVASVDREGGVRLLRVAVEHDYGAEIEIKHGLTGSESIIRSPGPQIKEGLRVQPFGDEGHGS